MRHLAAAALLALTPIAARAQLAPRSIALDLGYASDSAPSLGTTAPVGLSASWWIGDDLDLTARAAHAFAARTAGRGADEVYEAGLGLRRSFGSGRLRPYATLDAAFLLAATGALSGWDEGVRASAGAGLEVFVARDLSLACGASAGGALLASGAGPSFGLVLRAAGYF
jgi:hypothetical protein